MFNKLKLLFSRYIVYITVIGLTILVRENFPFSMYPMYNHFPNYAYTFYLEDDKGNNLASLLSISHGSLSHLFFNECNKLNMHYGYGTEDPEQLEIVSKNTIKSAINPAILEREQIQAVSLYRIHNYIDQQGHIVSDTNKLATIDTYERTSK